MKITGNENGKKLSDEVVSEEAIKTVADSNPLADTIFLNSLEVLVDVTEANYDDGEFKVQLGFNLAKELPSITVGIDNKQLAEDLFRNSNTSADNREGVLQFIKAGVLQAIVNSFSMTTFNDHLQILDEKLKSRTLEIQQANIQSGDLVKTEEVPNLITSQDDLEVSEVKPTKEMEDLKAQGFDEHSLVDDEEEIVSNEVVGQELQDTVQAVDFTSMAEDIEEPKQEVKKSTLPTNWDDEDDDVPANYKPLSDGTRDNQPLKSDSEEDEEEEDDGVMESIGKLNH